jgi:hypothetical protein
MKMLRTFASIVCYLIAAGLISASMIAFLDGEGTSAETQRRVMAAAFVVIAILIWIAAGAVARRPLFSIARVIVLVVIVVVGVVAAMNVMGASGRSRTKRTMADIRGISTALSAYAIDNRTYPNASDINSLASQLEPMYIREMPRTDGWGFPLRYEKSGEHFWIGAAAKNGVWQHAHLSDYAPATYESPEDDIVMRDNDFVRYPR